MKNSFKYIIIVAIVFLMVLSCGVTKRQQEKTNYPYGTTMKIACNIENGKQYQIDSIITADTLPPINKWLQSAYFDYETGKRYIKRLYIRTYKDSTESVYLILGDKEPYKITKRITQN